MEQRPLYIASCSFGKDSIATILLALEHNEPLDRAVFAEVMFDTERNISGEIPEHIEWIYSTAIPKLEAMGVKVDVVRTNDYMSFFHRRRGERSKPEYRGKREGFVIGGLCRMCGEKSASIRRYYKQFGDTPVVQYIGIAIDEPTRLERNTARGGYRYSQSMDIPKQWRKPSARSTDYFRQYTTLVAEVVAGFALTLRQSILCEYTRSFRTYGMSFA